MLKANSTIKLNMSRINKICEAKITALEKTAEALKTDIIQEQVIPFDTGALQNESTFVDYSHSSSGKVSLIHATPYARRLYYHPEFKFQKTENPNAKGRWLEDWEEGGSKEDVAREKYARFLKQEADL